MNLRIKLKLVFITFVVLMLSVAAHSSLMAGATGIQELDDELNLIINPGFEEGGSVPLNWRFLNVNTDSSWLWDPDEKYEGNKSVKLMLTSAEQRAVIEQSNIEVEAGKLYDLRFYYRTEDLTGEPWVRIAWFDAERNLIRSSDIVLEKSDSHWSKFETHVQAPEKTSYAMIQAQVWKGTGHVWYDLFDLSAMEMDEQGDMPVEEGSIYHVSLPYHSESTEIAPFFTISWFDSEERFLSSNVVELDKNMVDWSSFERSFIAPAHAAFLRINTPVWNLAGHVSYGQAVIVETNESNMVRNSDFEIGEQVPDYWEFSDFGQWEWDSEEQYSGNKSVKLMLIDADQVVSTGQKYVPAIETNHYEFKVAYRTESLGVMPFVKVTWYGPEYNELSSLQFDFEHSSEWLEAVKYIYAPIHAVFANIELGVQGGPGTGWFDQVEFKQAEGDLLISAYGESIPVSDLENINESLPPEQFWAKIPAIELDPPEGSIWTVDVLRQFFQGIGKSINDYGIDVAGRVMNRDANLPAFEGALGNSVDPLYPLIVAEDIAFRPIMKGHANYSDKYYPRRMQDYLLAEYIPAYLLTGDDYFKERGSELIDFLAFSQWTDEGENAFTSKYYPEEYQIHEEWAGGWDYLFDWEWLDAYGYKWSLHEPDHHVNSLIAFAILNSMDTLGSEQSEMLTMARRFLYNQMPRYGFHKGTWNNHTYYWTEYNPTGLSEGNPVSDATDNIMGLVALANAAMGYYESDETMKGKYLEYARGMLWYLVREFTYDGRFYYDGAENPLNQRKAVSHDRATLVPAFTALAYLYKAGVDVDILLDEFAKIDEAYLDIFGEKVDVIKMYDGIPAPNSELTFSTFVQVKNKEYENVVFKDFIPAGFIRSDLIELRFSELLPPDLQNPNWTVSSERDEVIQVTPEQLESGIEIPFSLNKRATYKVTYTLNTTPNFKVKSDAGLIAARDLLPPQDESGKEYKLVLGDAVFYRAEEAGDYLTFKIDVEVAGEYTLSSIFVQSPLYGKVQVLVDGQPLGDLYDGYNAEVRLDTPYVHGDVYLSAGEHSIRYKAVGKNEYSDNYYFGIDKIRLTLKDDEEGAELGNSSIAAMDEQFSSTTMSLASSLKVSSTNFLSFNAKVLFPFTEEISAKLVEWRQVSVKDIQQKVIYLDNRDAFVNENVTHALTLHLTAVNHFASNGADEKVIEHMKGFKVLINQFKNSNLMTEEAFQTLTTEANALIAFLTK